MKVLCNVIKDGQFYYTPIASAAHVDSADICNSGETLPHLHIDWRFMENSTGKQVRGWVNRLEIWQEYATTVASQGRECDPLHILAQGQVMLPSFGNNATVFRGEFEYADREKFRSDEEVAESVQFKTPFAYMTTYLGHTRGKKCGPLPASMVDLEAYKGCAICPHKQGLVVKGVCQAHGQIFNRDIFPLTVYFSAPNKFITVYEDRVTLVQDGTLAPWTIGMDEFLTKGVTLKADVDGSNLLPMIVTFDNTGKQIFYTDLSNRMTVYKGDSVTFSQQSCSLNGKNSGRIVRSIHDIAETA